MGDVAVVEDAGPRVIVTQEAPRVLVSEAGGSLSSVLSTNVVFQNTDRVLGRMTAGGGPGEEIPCTSVGRTIIGSATVADVVAYLGLTIGTDVQAYDADLAAIAAFAGTGIPARIGVGSWALRLITGTTDRVTVTDGDGVAGQPTVDIAATYAGQSSITTLGTITTGTWAASFPAGGGVNSTGEVGIRVAPSTASALTLGLPSSTATALLAANWDLTAPSTATVALFGARSTLQTAAAAFTLTKLAHFSALSSTKGAGSTITSVFGFEARNAIAVGANNYGFFSDIANAANTYQLYMVGTAPSYIGGSLRVMGTNADAMLPVGSSVWTHTSTAATIYGVPVDFVVPSTAISSTRAFQSVIRTAAVAFTAGSAIHYYAGATVLGAGSTITQVFCFFADNGTAVGTNNYGFYSDIVAGANNYQLRLNGTAASVVMGPFSILVATTQNDVLLRVGSATTHPNTGVSAWGQHTSIIAPATMTAFLTGHEMRLGSVAAAFTISTGITFYDAFSTSKGAGSTITNVHGYRARNAIAVGTSNYGFWSDIAEAANTYQLYMAGTARSFFNGQVSFFNTNAAANLAGVVAIQGTHPDATATSARGFAVSLTGASTATGSVIGSFASVSTAAAAFTTSFAMGYYAASFTKGAGSTITNAMGFFVQNSIAVGTNNYGFYSDINSATNTYQLYMAGTAPSFIGGSLHLGAAVSNNHDVLFRLGSNSVAHPGTATSLYMTVAASYCSSSTTVTFQAFRSTITTAASAFTLADIVHFNAVGAAKGAGSTVNTVYGFAAVNSMAIGGTNYGFYSNIASASNTYQLYMGGTAPSLFGGAVIEKEITVTYSASMTIDARTGNEQIITATNNTAFTINAPTNPATGQYLEITIRNTSGGALGAATWNAVFKMTAWTQPANGNSRTIVFRYNGTNWVEKGRTAADVPN